MSATDETTRCECGAVVDRVIPDGARWGDFLASLPVVCPECATTQAEEEERRDRAELARVRRQRRLDASDVPAALQGLAWSDLSLPGREGAIEAAKRWAAGDLAGLALQGPIGTGKTRLAAAAANEALRDRPVRWTSAPLLFARLGSGFDTPQRDAAIATLTGTTALVLDDLDKARPTEYGAEQIFLAVDHRVTHGKGLLVTLNLSSDELRHKFPEPFGEAIASRLVGYCEGHRMEGTDRRLSQGGGTV